MEVFSTSAGTVYQSDTERCIYLDFLGNRAKFDFSSLMRLKRSVEQVDIEHMLLNVADTPDLEIISICACSHIYVLNIIEIVALKELLQGTFVMFELNHIINDRLNRLAHLSC